MLKQLQSRISPSSSPSAGKRRKQDKPLSCTETSIEASSTEVSSTQRSPALKCREGEFEFALKLKMVGIMRALGYSHLEAAEVNSKDPYGILNELYTRVSKYQREASKNYNQERNRRKALEIRIINLEAEMNKLQSQVEKKEQKLQRSLKQLGHKTKQADVQVTKTQIRLRNLQKQLVRITASKQQDEKTLQSMRIQISQSNALNQKLTEEIRAKNVEISLINSRLAMKIEVQQQAQLLINSLNSQNNELNKSNAQIAQVLRQKVQQLTTMLQKQQSKNNKLLQQNQKLMDRIHKFTEVREKIEQARLFQHHVHTEVEWLRQLVIPFIVQVESKFEREYKFIRQQYDIALRQQQLRIEKMYVDRIYELQDKLFEAVSKNVNSLQ